MSLRLDICWVRDLDHLQLHQQLGLSHTCEPEQQLSLVHTVTMVLMFFCSIRGWWVMEEGVFYSVSPILMVPSTICQAIPQECLHQCLSSDFEIFLPQWQRSYDCCLSASDIVALCSSKSTLSPARGQMDISQIDVASFLAPPIGPLSILYTGDSVWKSVMYSTF